MHKRRILVVDDEPGFTRLIKLNLERTGSYEVREEQEPARALAVAHEFQPDLILLDMVFPGVEGGEILRQIRADARLQAIPVLMVTALVCREDAPGGLLQRGQEYFVPKPVGTRDLIALIESRLRLPPTQGAVVAPPPLSKEGLLTPDPA